MASYNKVILLGNLTRDPELRYMPSQKAVVDFGLATNRKWRSSDGQDRTEACFIDCTMFGRRAEVISKYFSKGSPIFVEGRLTYDSWTSQDGTKRSKLKVTVENFEFVGSQGGGRVNGGGGADRDGYSSDMSQDDDMMDDGYDSAADDIPF